MTTDNISRSKRWYLMQLRLRHDLTPAEQHELDMADAAYGLRWWMGVVERRWFENADAVAAFREVRGFWPVRSSSSAEEARLGKWLGWCRMSDRGKGSGRKWDHNRRDYLDEAAPGWRGDDDARWRSGADAFVSFVADAGRWPSLHATTAGERRTAIWLDKCRQGDRWNHRLLETWPC